MVSADKNMELLVQQDGAVAQATMNRPESLNALSLEMIRTLSANLSAWENDPSVRAVFVDGAGGRAFCAGGDVKSTYRIGMAFRRGEADESVLMLFFAEEYGLNRQLFHFKKPLLAFMNGITMGGGFGVAGPCRYRIASEKTLFAMPETGIGLFPDVGSMYFLTRCPGGAGAYLALTGSSIGPDDMLYCGLATHYIPLARQAECRAKISAALDSGGGDGAIAEILADFHAPSGEAGPLQTNAECVDRCFSGPDVRDIAAKLRADDSPWAQQQGDIIESRSPMSLKVSLEHFRRSKALDFDAITAQDFILTRHFLRGHDFYEGVRAVLIDKDKQPQWDPKSLDDVSSGAVPEYFRAQGPELDEAAA